MKAAIRYQDIQRIETVPVHKEALREALLNALVHKDDAVHSPVKIRIYADSLKIWNPAELPEGWTLGKLPGEHSSRPFNPLVANAFFRAGEIEARGRGIQQIFEACRASGTPEPSIRLEGNDLWFVFQFSEDYLAMLQEKRYEENTPKTSVKILAFLEENPDMTLARIAEAVGLSLRAVEMAAAKLVKEGYLKYVGPKKGDHWEVIRK